MKVTMKEVAALAGVGVETVLRVLTDLGSKTALTRKYRLLSKNSIISQMNMPEG
ncbi:Uncharacterised protein [Streptococcus mutans]|uniref:Uncharacterized protein n=1 Tax=Streptococcus ratti FA-1 = DSM 20564 TaxID=699248 RepID=A0ABN0GVB9_STRRT|nr:hypothetical protein SRA_07081 [Streptococcus ratti FA-1 = DSM 20564]QEY06234.1 LacI family DNA-binding transcriptional regulator [Streptococcus ratti]VEI60574.1 Uncharacterised protein [Streptococcus mutans]